MYEAYMKLNVEDGFDDVKAGMKACFDVDRTRVLKLV